MTLCYRVYIFGEQIITSLHKQRLSGVLSPGMSYDKNKVAIEEREQEAESVFLGYNAMKFKCVHLILSVSYFIVKV